MNKYGYWQQVIRVDGKPKTFTIHTLVAMAWHGPKPEGLQVNHINGIKSDNRPENLEYVTLAENKAHGVRLSLFPKGERNGRAKLTKEQVAEIRDMNARGVGQDRLARMFGVAPFNIYCIVHRITWRDVDGSDEATA